MPHCAETLPPNNHAEEGNRRQTRVIVEALRLPRHYVCRVKLEI
jgi:hypothetical protein